MIVCSVSGWGQDGPYAARAGHDLTYQAIAGALAPSAPAIRPIRRRTPPAPGRRCRRSSRRCGAGTDRRGSPIDASLFDAALHTDLVAWAEEAGGARPLGWAARHGLAGALPCYRLYRTADGGLLAVAALEPHFWRASAGPRAAPTW